MKEAETLYWITPKQEKMRVKGAVGMDEIIQSITIRQAIEELFPQDRKTDLWEKTLEAIFDGRRMVTDLLRRGGAINQSASFIFLGQTPDLSLEIRSKLRRSPFVKGRAGDFNARIPVVPNERVFFIAPGCDEYISYKLNHRGIAHPFVVFPDGVKGIDFNFSLGGAFSNLYKVCFRKQGLNYFPVSPDVLSAQTLIDVAKNSGFGDITLGMLPPLKTVV